jgi:formate-dependent phosphoribosylglycinamide formyltransferase (GAR transformylase)
VRRDGESMGRTMKNVVFVAPYALEATVRFVDAVAHVEDARVGLVSSDAVEAFPEPVRRVIAGHWRTDDCLDVDQLVNATSRMQAHLGSVDRLVAILENLQVPLGAVRDRMGIEGLGAAVADNFRDKSRMKAAFEAAGVPCARSQRVDSEDDARAFAGRVGFPFVAKPLAGAGARNTFRVDRAEQLEQWLASTAPHPGDPMLLEEFVTGVEHSFDSVVINGRLVWYSIGRYLPTPLDVLENPWIQWCVLLPRDVAGPEYADIAGVATHAVTSLGLQTGLSHMEWFRRPDGSFAISEVGARPPGAQFMTLMSYAHDVEMYAAWARLAVHDWFRPPERRYAVGAAYLRAQGQGRAIVAAHGLDQVSLDSRELIVDARLPAPGDPPTGTYEGDGFVIVRADETAAVESALAEIVGKIRLECG